MFEYAFMQNAAVVAVLISLVCPLIGIFLVLRRYSMIGDALSHASLAGVAVGLALHANPIMSAFVITSCFGLLIEGLRRRFSRYSELILVIILTFSVGILRLSARALYELMLRVFYSAVFLRLRMKMSYPLSS